MAKKVFPKSGREFFDRESGRTVADVSSSQRNFSNLKTEIGFIREAFPHRSKDDITLVLQSCDRSVEAAIACFANGEADDILRQWNIQGKKSKNGHSSKKKRNKKKQAKANEQESHDVETVSQTSDDIPETKLDSIKGSILDSEEATIKISTVTSVECPSKLPGLSLLHPPSPSDSETSLPSPSSEKTLGHSPVVELQKKPLSDNFSSAVKLERMPSGPDALKKTVKDLQRSSVSLARFQLLLEEECEKCFKVMTKTFEELRQCLSKRETQLYSEMEEFKKQAVELLEQRQENAAALKLKSERVGGMKEAEVILLRSEIKNFVTERKIDEELARTTRFVGDKEKMLAVINNFGEVVPIKSCYSPVTLNPPSVPTKTVEKDPLKNKSSTHDTVPNSTTISTDVAKTVPKVVVPVKSALSSHETVQEAAETHAKLQVALQKQGLAGSAGKKCEDQKQTNDDIKKDRPASAPHKPSQRHLLSPRQQTFLVPSEGQKSQPQNIRQDRPPRGQNRTQQNRQQARQPDRDSRRPNQRRSTQREHGAELSNSKKEVELERPQLTQKLVESKKMQQSQKSESDLEGVASETVRSDAPSKKLESVEKREGGNERGRNKRFRRRGDSAGTSEGNSSTSQHNQSKENGLHERHDNGPRSTNSTEAVIKESGNHSHVKHDESDAIRQQSAENNVSNVRNGPAKESTLHSEALPQRPERSSHRRGPQWGRKDGLMRRPAANGVVDDRGDKDRTKSDVKNTTEIPVVKESSAVENVDGCASPDHEIPSDVHLDKPSNPLVNGCIPAKEFKEDYTIDR